MSYATGDSREGGSGMLAGFLLFIVGVSVLVGVFALFGSFGTVDTGNRGVVLRMQNPTGEIKEQGFYWKTPFVEDVIEMPVQIKKEEAEASAASKDLQDVTTKIALNYHLDPSKVGVIYQEVKKEWASVIVQPAIQEAVKNATSKYTAEELITKRSEVQEAISVNIKEKVTPRGIVVDEVNIINFDFSQSFGAAIERKVTAEQEALASKNQLERIKYEAQQAIEKAKGEAESIRIQSQALTEQPQYLEKLAIERWNGVLPTYMTDGATTPFININR
jgi:prohibitin 2